MENEKLRNEFILQESEPGKIISKLSFKEFKVIGIDNQWFILKIFKEEAYWISYKRNRWYSKYFL